MKNIDMQFKGTKLVLTIDMDKSHGPSKSGKTTIIATTSGNQPIDGFPTAFIGVNVYTKP